MMLTVLSSLIAHAESFIDQALNVGQRGCLGAMVHRGLSMCRTEVAPAKAGVNVSDSANVIEPAVI